MASFQQAKVSHSQRLKMAPILQRILRDAGMPQQEIPGAVHRFLFEEASAWCEPDLFTLGYTGWRHANREKVQADLARIHDEVGPMRLIVGFDPDKRTPGGGDIHAYDWGVQAPGVVVECLPAAWDAHPLLKWSAGFYRNGAIVERTLAAAGNKALLAHLHPKSRGAAGTAAYARWRGLEVIEEEAV